MPIRADELLKAADIVARNRNFQVAMKNTLAAGAITGLTTVVSGLVFGPLGLIAGGALGGVLGFAVSKEFKPLYMIIEEDLTKAQKQALIYHLNEALNDFHINDAIMLSSLVLTNASIERAVAQCLITFSKNQLQAEMF